MKTYTLKLLAAIGIAGALHRAGSLVDVDETTAKSLLQRGKARTPTEDEMRAAGRLQDAKEGEASSGGKPSDGLKVDELKAALDAKGIKYPDTAKKPELAALLDAAPAA